MGWDLLPSGEEEEERRERRGRGGEKKTQIIIIIIIMNVKGRIMYYRLGWEFNACGGQRGQRLALCPGVIFQKEAEAGEKEKHRISEDWR